jgi:hypothetical protein
VSQEIVYTSAPRGLRSGMRGFVTVLSTDGMAENLADRLESYSGYRHLFGVNDEKRKLNPVNWSFTTMRVGGECLYVISRISDAGLDYSGRSNKLAHHISMNADELPTAGPARLLSTEGIMYQEWSGEIRRVAQRQPPAVEPMLSVDCKTWKSVTGDAGWAGYVAEKLIEAPTPELNIIFPLGVDAFQLVVEVFDLLPLNKRWQITFSTFFTRLAPGTECHLRFIPAGTPEAAEIRKNSRALVLDLTTALQAAHGEGLVDAARSGKLPDSLRMDLVRKDNSRLSPQDASIDLTGGKKVSHANRSNQNVPGRKTSAEDEILPLVHPRHSQKLPPSLSEHYTPDEEETDVPETRNMNWPLVLISSTVGIVLVLSLLIFVIVPGVFSFTGRSVQEPVAMNQNGSRPFGENAVVDVIKPPDGSQISPSVHSSSENKSEALPESTTPVEAASQPQTNPTQGTPDHPPPPASEPNSPGIDERPNTTNNLPPAIPNPFESLSKSNSPDLRLLKLPPTTDLQTEAEWEFDLPDATQFQMTLLGSDAFISGSAKLVLEENQQIAGEDPTWTIVLNAGGISGEIPLGKFSLRHKDSRSRLTFRWLEKAPETTEAGLIPSMAIGMSYGQFHQVCRLSEPVRKPALSMTLPNNKHDTERQIDVPKHLLDGLAAIDSRLHLRAALAGTALNHIPEDKSRPSIYVLKKKTKIPLIDTPPLETGQENQNPSIAEIGIRPSVTSDSLSIQLTTHALPPVYSEKELKDAIDPPKDESTGLPLFIPPSPKDVPLLPKDVQIILSPAHAKFCTEELTLLLAGIREKKKNIENIPTEGKSPEEVNRKKIDLDHCSTLIGQYESQLQLHTPKNFEALKSRLVGDGETKTECIRDIVEDISISYDISYDVRFADKTVAITLLEGAK